MQAPVISSSDLVMSATIKKLREHFNKDIVSRQEVLSYVQSGGYVPTKFWNVKSIGRGVYKLSDEVSLEGMTTNDVSTMAAPVIPIKQTVAVAPVQQTSSSDVVSHFHRDSLIPPLNQNYVEWGNYKLVKKMIQSDKFFTLYITGESGSGKNEMISQACASLKKPMVRVSITSDTREEHLIGSKTLVDGNIKYEEGPLIWCAENGALLILDEISVGRSEELMCLQAALEGNEFFIKSLNRVVKPAPGFCVIATDNTKGRGSDSGRYMGTNILNDAFLERFMMTMEQGYPTAKVEKEIFTRVMKHHGKDDEAFVQQLVNWIHVIRKTYDDEAIEEQITTRRGCHIVNVYCMFASAKEAIELCTNRFDDTTKQAFSVLWDKLSAGEVLSGIPTDAE
jgi:hypothetical protein